MVSPSPQRRWRSSERIALSVLEELGYRIIETNKKIRIEGVEVTEIDAIVEDENGEKYAVEVKAGRIDVSGLRQAYVNAVLAGCKPLVIAKGYADEAAEALARELGVKVILLSDYFLVEAEELELIVREALDDVLTETINTIVSTRHPSPEDLEFIEYLVSCETIVDVANRLGVSIKDVVKRIKQLQNKGVLPRSVKNYRRLRYYAALVLFREKLRFLVETLKSSLKS